MSGSFLSAPLNLKVQPPTWKTIGPCIPSRLQQVKYLKLLSLINNFFIFFQSINTSANTSTAFLRGIPPDLLETFNDLSLKVSRRSGDILTYLLTPIYLRALCVPISSFEGRSHLRSATAGDLRIPSTKTVTIGRRGFSVAGPAAWNNLSTTLKDFKLTFSAFKRLLKTELFKSM